MKSFSMKMLFDLHVHFRQGDMLRKVVQHTAQHCYRALVMPNTDPAIRTLEQAVAYKEAIMAARGAYTHFEPLMTFKIYPDTDPQMIRSFRYVSDWREPVQTCVVAGKVYPKGLTTHANDGVEDFLDLHPVYEAMEEYNLVLCLHGEATDPAIKDDYQREKKFLRTLKAIAKSHPDLKIVMEHITTEAAVEAILDLPDTVRATITAHHLVLTHDDVAGKRCCPDHFCKPTAKDWADRQALRWAATSGCPKFFFGSDSAPHPREGKERGMDCCAGIFTAPVAVPVVAQVFDEEGAFDWPHGVSRFKGFMRDFGGQFYKIGEPMSSPAPEITLVKKDWVVPASYDDIAPFLAGETLHWQVQE